MPRPVAARSAASCSATSSTRASRGVAYPVNPKAAAVAGVRAYASIADIPDPVDLAVFCLPGEPFSPEAEAALREGHAGAVRDLGRVRRDRCRRRPSPGRSCSRRVRAYGARLIGPNCLGVFSAGARAERDLRAAHVPCRATSASLRRAARSAWRVLERGASRGLGLSAFVSVGNKADVSSNDLLEYWEDDPDTDLVLLYLESFGNPRKFARLARRVSRKKPILAMKGGRTSAGQRAAGSHTAALAGSTAAVEALFRQAGVIEADSLEELADAAVLLSSQPLPQGRRVAVLTNAGGLGILCADACAGAGLELPQLARRDARRDWRESLPREASLANPVDMLGSAVCRDVRGGGSARARRPRHRRSDRVVRAAGRRRCGGGRGGGRPRCRGRRGARQAGAGRVHLRRGDPASLLRRGSGVAALRVSRSRPPGRSAHAVDRAEWLRRPVGEPPELDGIDRPAAEALVASRPRLGRRRVADARTQVRGLLGAYGIPLVAERVGGDGATRRSRRRWSWGSRWS